MRTITFIAAIIMAASNCLFSQQSGSGNDMNWPQWRGPDANGVAPWGDPPVEWSEDKNVKWKVEVPGAGHATPIIWKDQIILLSAVPTAQKAETSEQEGEGGQDWMTPNKTDLIHDFVVISLDRETGKKLWQTSLKQELPHNQTHQLGSWASHSPVTDGEHIYAYFGSHGLYCLNMKGEVVWERDFGKMEKVMSFGEGSSPQLYKDKLIILRDHQGQSTLHVMDKKTGKDIWSVEREEVSSWATPIVIEAGGKTQLITSASTKIRSYDLNTSELIWESTGMTRNVIPTPVVYGNIVYLLSGFRGSALQAVDASIAKGDIAGTDAIVWTYDKNTSYTPSPVLMEDKLYFLKVNNGYLTCLDAKDGTEYYINQPLEGIKSIYASPLGVKDRIYIPGAEGTFSVVKLGPQFEVIAKNVLEDGFHASPVVIGNELFLRGFRYLYCIAEE